MKSTRLFLFPLFVITFLGAGNASNILGLFLHPGYSHFRVFYPIFLGLADRGHNLTIVSYFKAPHKPDNYHEIILTGEKGTDVFDLRGRTPSRSLGEMYNEFWLLADEGKRACEIFFSSGVVEKILAVHAVRPFDLIVTEFFNTDCHLGLAHMLSAPFVGFSSCALMPWHYDRVGLPDFPSFIPNEFVGFSEDMGYWERFVNFLVTRGTKLLYRFVEKSDNEIIRKYLHIDVDVREIAKKTSLILVNQHFSLSGARPLVPQVIEISGVHIDANKGSIPGDLEKFLNSAEDGVIFISWGSMVKGSTLPEKMVHSILSALKRFPQKVVWKWESESVPTKSEKFFFSRWIPQKDVLCHPNVQLFWSHGGLLGVSEAVFCGKPLLVTPIYGDQFLNAKAVKNRRVAEILYFEHIDEENVYRKIARLQSDNFSENAVLLSETYKRRRITPLEEALWWIEYVLETKGRTLSHSPSVEMNWFVYYSVDVAVGVAAGFCTVTLGFILLVRSLGKFLRGSETGAQKRKVA